MFIYYILSTCHIVLFINCLRLCFVIEYEYYYVLTLQCDIIYFITIICQYFRCGNKGGKDVYFQHGYGNTGKVIFTVPEICHAAEKLNLHLFSPSQPGFGLSSTYPLDKVRKLSEWPSDIDLILKQEQINNFYVGGWSAGCVHALTIANAYSDRVLGIAISTPTAPLSAELLTNSDMALPTKIVKYTFPIPYVGDLLGFLMSLMDGRQRMAAAPDVAAALDKMERLGNDGEEKWHSILNGFVTDQNRGMIKGYRGWQDNMAILNEDVPFDTKTLAAKMQGKKIIITSAADDTTNPPIMQTWWQEQLPGSELMQCKVGFGHMHCVDTGVMTELFRRMIGEEANVHFQ